MQESFQLETMGVAIVSLITERRADSIQLSQTMTQIVISIFLWFFLILISTFYVLTMLIATLPYVYVYSCVVYMIVSLKIIFSPSLDLIFGVFH